MQNVDGSLPDGSLIENPSDFRRWLHTLRSLVALGALRQYFDASNQFASDTTVSDVPLDGPWPDFVEWYFETPTGIRYRFSVETYHGAGGRWQRI